MHRSMITIVFAGLFASLAHAEEPLTTPCIEPNAAPAVQLTQMGKKPFADGARLRELGLKGYLGQAHEGGAMGGALYLRLRHQGGNYGVELSQDLISDQSFRQAALLRYFNDHSRHGGYWQPYLAVGVGRPYNFIFSDFSYTTGHSLQAGGGIDARLSKRFTINADLRAFTASTEIHSFGTTSSLSFGVVLASLSMSITYESPVARAIKAVKGVSPYYSR